MKIYISNQYYKKPRLTLLAYIACHFLGASCDYANINKKMTNEPIDDIEHPRGTNHANKINELLESINHKSNIEQPCESGTLIAAYDNFIDTASELATEITNYTELYQYLCKQYTNCYDYTQIMKNIRKEISDDMNSLNNPLYEDLPDLLHQYKNRINLNKQAYDEQINLIAKIADELEIENELEYFYNNLLKIEKEVEGNISNNSNSNLSESIFAFSDAPCKQEDNYEIPIQEYEKIYSLIELAVESITKKLKENIASIKNGLFDKLLKKT